MLYRPNQHGELAPRERAAGSARKLELGHLELCFAMATDFRQAAFDAPRISAEFKHATARRVAVMSQLNPRPPR